MNESELTELLFRIGARCNIEQYEMLKRCSEKKDTTEWNEWREANPKEEIWLSGAYLKDTHLKGAKLRVAHLERANLDKTHLEDAVLRRAHLEGARLFEAYLKNADLSSAHLESVILSATDMESAKLLGAYMEGAELCQANLEGAHLGNVHLEGADMYEAHLEGAKLVGAYLESTDFEIATVDSSTLIWDCKVNKQTNFAGVGMDRARVEPGVKQLLEYNIRLRYWRRWYKKHRFGQYPVRLFWSISDYGRSTLWIVLWFFGLALLFAGIYCCRPDFLTVRGDHLRGFFHAFYFSVVKMTTLGFGDIHANPDNWIGQALLMLQVILGYVLLGALITRFAVLFTAGGPAAKFSKKKTHFPPRLRIQLRTLRKRTSEKFGNAQK